MSLIKTPEEEFIQELEGYLDTKFDKYSVSRVMGYLGKYKNSLPVQQVTVPTKIITRDRVVYRQLKTKDIEPKEVIIDAIAPKQILQLVSQATGLTLKNITGRDRHTKVVLARHVAMYVIRDLCGHTLTSIGKIFNRDHTTVIHSISHVIDMIEVGNEQHIKLIGYVNFHLSTEEKKSA